MRRPRSRPLHAPARPARARGLLDETLIVIGTEFGRTPDINQNVNGRDHYSARLLRPAGPAAASPGGRCYGKTDKEGREIIEGRTEIPDFNATIAYALGLPLDQIIYSPSKRPFTVCDKGQPITSLFALITR